MADNQRSHGAPKEEPGKEMQKLHVPDCVQSEESEDDSECHELEVENEFEADPLDRYNRCTKKYRHSEYLPVDQFGENNLPPQYRSKNMLHLVKQQGILTVLLKVSGNSEKRPKYVPGTDISYPFSGWRYRNAVRCGSGRIHCVISHPSFYLGDEGCPCNACKSSGKLRKEFAKIHVCTAAHVIFDVVEGKKTVCYFNYVSEEIDRNSCPCLSIATEVTCNVEHDISYVTFVTHDLEFAAQLSKSCKTYYDLSQKVKGEFGVIQDDSDKDEGLFVRISKLYEKFIETDMKYNKIIDSLKGIVSSGDVEQMYSEYRRKYKIKPGDLLSSYGTLLQDKSVGGNRCSEVLGDINQSYQHFARLTGVGALKDDYNSLVSSHGVKYVQDQYEICKITLLEMNTLLQGLSVEPSDYRTDDERADQPDVRQFYDSSHPLTIIVSHPHGLSKKISIGEVAERKHTRSNWKI